jgi:hypothetical protein
MQTGMWFGARFAELKLLSTLKNVRVGTVLNHCSRSCHVSRGSEQRGVLLERLRYLS